MTQHERYQNPALAARKLNALHESITKHLSTDETEGNTVSLGSVVDIRYDNTGNIITTLVTGATHDVKDFCGRSDVKGVTIFSPIGKAILDLSVGDSTEVTINNKKIPISITRIRSLSELSA
jgi:transcription elongation factor, greA/greB, C-term